jgi:hypothetical protein
MKAAKMSAKMDQNKDETEGMMQPSADAQLKLVEWRWMSIEGLEAQGIKIRAYREGDVSRDGRGIGQSDASGKRSLGQPCATMAGLLAR